jgi:hypothetical protein
MSETGINTQFGISDSGAWFEGRTSAEICTAPAGEKTSSQAFELGGLPSKDFRVDHPVDSKGERKRWSGLLSADLDSDGIEKTVSNFPIVRF